VWGEKQPEIRTALEDVISCTVYVRSGSSVVSHIYIIHYNTIYNIYIGSSNDMVDK
jgi:hypothetical protein